MLLLNIFLLFLFLLKDAYSSNDFKNDHSVSSDNIVTVSQDTGNVSVASASLLQSVNLGELNSVQPHHEIIDDALITVNYDSGVSISDSVSSDYVTRRRLSCFTCLRNVLLSFYCISTEVDDD